MVHLAADEIQRVIIRTARLRFVGHERLCERGLQLILADFAVLEHEVQHLVALHHGGVVVMIGRKDIRAADDTGKHGRLPQGQLHGRFIKIPGGRLLEPHEGMSPENAVDVAGENGLLVKSGLDTPREGHLRELRIKVAVAVVVGGLGQLHGEGGSPLRGAVVFEHLPHRAHHTAKIYTAVGKEGAVLLQDECVDKITRHFGIQVRDAAAVLSVQRTHLLAPAVQHDAALRHAVNLRDVVPPGLDAVDDAYEDHRKETDKGKTEDETQRPQDDLRQGTRDEVDEAEGEGAEQPHAAPQGCAFLRRPNDLLQWVVLRGFDALRKFPPRARQRGRLCLRDGTGRWRGAGRLLSPGFLAPRRRGGVLIPRRGRFLLRVGLRLGARRLQARSRGGLRLRIAAPPSPVLGCGVFLRCFVSRAHLLPFGPPSL